MTNERLREMVAPFGEVRDCSVIMDKVTGQSRGFGFVQLASPEQANNAIQVRHHAPASIAAFLRRSFFVLEAGLGAGWAHVLSRHGDSCASKGIKKLFGTGQACPPAPG
jgi:hypothetical protein